MERKKLAHTDLEVSKVCMGTMTFGSQTDEAVAETMVDRCLEAGVNFFDTANVYNQGKSEEIVGRILRGKRDKVILASKVRGLMKDDPPYSGLSRQAVQRAIDESLRRLQTDYLDIYYLHQPDYETPIEETLDVMEELRAAGKFRYLATSNYSAWQVCEIAWIREKRGCQAPWISQPMYNMLARGIEQEYLSFAQRFEVSNICYNPLAGGLLSGKQNFRSGPLPGTRFDGNQMYLNRYWNADHFEAVESFKEIARRAGRSLPELALAWVAQQPGVNSVILGASKLEHLEANLRAVEGPPLDEPVLDACDKVWEKLKGSTPQYNR